VWQVLVAQAHLLLAYRSKLVFLADTVMTIMYVGRWSFQPGCVRRFVCSGLRAKLTCAVTLAEPHSRAGTVGSLPANRLSPPDLWMWLPANPRPHKVCAFGDVCRCPYSNKASSYIKNCCCKPICRHVRQGDQQIVCKPGQGDRAVRAHAVYIGNVPEMRLLILFRVTGVQ
jgi:hypothetical protein